MSEPRPKVLLVDDVDANLVALEGLLGRMSCDLVRARSGNEALRLLLRHEFAVVLLDVQMPQMDGYEVAQHARDNPATRHVPIIFVTATHETKENVLRGYDAGAFDLLFKPVDPYILRSKVQVFLDLYLNRLRLRAEIDAHKQTLAEVEAFNYSVSHDLRAPLRPLDGFSEVLLEEYGDKLDDRGRDYLRRIRAAARRMGQLIDDLLELSRVGRLALRRHPVDLSALVASIVEQMRSDQGDREIELLCAAGVEAQVDERVLRIALENLLRNAWKFTAKQPQARIEFGRSSDSNELIYFVRDNGVGFDSTYAEKLFQPFQRLHGSDYPGTGIGLAIVDRIIRRHEGRIWGESTPGQGATFYFTLAPRPAG
ncbi:MAG TPA: response regulator [Polyangia bacterium]|nr:response regulator [Polyangia bacterium]